VVITIVVAVVKPEREDDEEVPTSVLRIYRDMVSVLRLESVQTLSLILLTCGIPFVSGLVGVKFQDAGVSSEVIALLATLTTPVHIALPWLVARYLPRIPPLTAFRLAFPLRLMFQLVSVALVVLTPLAIGSSSQVGIMVFYAVCLVVSSIESAVMQVMFVSKMTFFARVSDPVIGGTFMTVLNTISNVGGNVASQLSYWLAQLGTVPNVVDGFYVVIALATVYGFVWLKIFGPRLGELEKRSEQDWRVPRRTKAV
jgi:PAT family acetyl-CoA transporter-like MFS transporter 1